MNTTTTTTCPACRGTATIVDGGRIRCDDTGIAGTREQLAEGRLLADIVSRREPGQTPSEAIAAWEVSQ